MLGAHPKHDYRKNVSSSVMHRDSPTPSLIMSSSFTFKATLWVYPGAAAWHFVTVPKTISEKIRMQYKKSQRPWGSIRVQATQGKTTWSTSLFRSTEVDAYVLPIKSIIRKKEKNSNGDTISLTIKIL